MTYDDIEAKHLTALAKKTNIYEILVNKFGERYVEYRGKWQLATERKEYFQVPLELDIDFTNTCNMACRHCNAMRDDILGKKYTLDVDILKKRLAESIPLGVEAIAFGNGSEPLLSADKVFDLIDYVKGLGAIDTLLHTGGLLLNEENTEKIINSGITKVCISVDAYSEETFKKIGRKNFKKVVDNIMCFLEKRAKTNSGLPILRLSFLPSQYNYMEVEEFQEFWKDKVDTAELQCILDVEKNSEINKLPVFEKYVFECDDPWKRMSIWSNNTYGVCCQYYAFEADGPMNLGSLYDCSVEEVWNSSKMNDIRNGLKDNNLSKECYECMHNTYRYIGRKD